MSEEWKIEKELRRKERDLSIIGNTHRLAILYLLYENESKLNFNTIADSLKLKRNKLAYHIALLKDAFLISNEMRVDDKEGKSFSFYGLTEKGKRMINLIEKMTEEFTVNESTLDEILK